MRVITGSWVSFLMAAHSSSAGSRDAVSLLVPAHPQVLGCPALHPGSLALAATCLHNPASKQVSEQVSDE